MGYMNLHFTKLDWLQKQNPIQITQGFHGRFQDNTAMDFGPQPLIAPLDGCRIDGSIGSGTQQYFNIHLPVYGKVYIQAVHGRPARTGTFKRGEVMGYCNWHHWHLAINVNGVWHGLLTYIRRDLGLQLLGSPWKNPYDKWSFYNNRTLAVQVTSQVVSTPQPDLDNNKPFVPAPVPEKEQPGTDLVEPPVQEEDSRDIVETPVTTEPEPTVPQKDYDELVAKVVDLVRQQNLEAWSWNKFFVGMSKVGVYELLLSIAVSISLAYLEQGDASLSTLLVGGAISVLKALKQALRG